MVAVVPPRSGWWRWAAARQAVRRLSVLSSSRPASSKTRALAWGTERPSDSRRHASHSASSRAQRRSWRRQRACSACQRACRSARRAPNSFHHRRPAAPARLLGLPAGLPLRPPGTELVPPPAPGGAVPVERTQLGGRTLPEAGTVPPARLLARIRAERRHRPRRRWPRPDAAARRPLTPAPRRPTDPRVAIPTGHAPSRKVTRNTRGPRGPASGVTSYPRPTPAPGNPDHQGRAPGNVPGVMEEVRKCANQNGSARCVRSP